MTNEQLKALEDKLWESANALRAYGGIKAADYEVPVLGLIFLKFADNKYRQHEADILAEYQQHQGSRMETPIETIATRKVGFYLPEQARYQHLLELPEQHSMAQALEQAMEALEKQDTRFAGVLPTKAYFDIEAKKADILPALLKAFADIPQDASGDIFGKIYEYFLGKFALSEGQKGGQFFTPTSVVRLIVEFIEPYQGKIYDPACGSGGMFVQSATFVRQANQDIKDIYVCGQEFMGETVRLAKMNLLINNLRGEIAEVNSYQSDPHQSLGKFDFVMANPPFNVKSVKESTVKDDPRFYHYGLPKAKGKKNLDKISDANYLWISLFATSLNEQGRAGFVMPNSASDARNAEYDIRRKIVDSGIVDCMVSMPSNMFFTVTLPATLWFFDKQKINSDRHDKILFLDARNVYHQIDRAHREWTEEQQQNLAAIVRLYRGENHRFTTLVAHYLRQAEQSWQALTEPRRQLRQGLEQVQRAILAYIHQLKEANTRENDQVAELDQLGFFEKQAAYAKVSQQGPEADYTPDLQATPEDNPGQHQAATTLKTLLENEDAFYQIRKIETTQLIALWQIVEQHRKQQKKKKAKKSKKAPGETKESESLTKANKTLEANLLAYTEAKAQLAYWHEQIDWLQSRFPEATYRDVTGLCKIADRTEYAEEQDYSLNAGRYVGVEIEDDKVSEEEFRERLKQKLLKFEELTEKNKDLSQSIQKNLEQIIHG